MRTHIIFGVGAFLIFPQSSAYPQAAQGVTELVRAGDSLYAAGSRVEAAAAYRQVVQRDSSASSRAVYRLAVILAETGDFRDAIALHTLYAKLEPNDADGTLGFARTYSWAGRTNDALALYTRVAAQHPDNRDAALGAAQVLAWGGRFPESVATYRAWLARRPNDREAALSLARTFAWWGKLAESARLYDSLRSSSSDTDARKGLALVAAWQGDLVRSERLWRELAQEKPNDAEIWTGLAQVLRWRGQPFDAREALDRALALDPAHRDARTQRRWLDSELAPTLYGRVVGTGDSDDNEAQVYTLEAATRPWRRIGVRLDAQQVRAQRLAAEQISQTARGRLTFRLPWNSGELTARAELGANRRNRDNQARAIGQLSLGGRLSQRSSGEIRVGRSVVDETVALIAAGIRMTSLEADWESQLGDRFNMSASLGSSGIDSDTAHNRRLAASLGARWVLTHGRSFGLTMRSINHQREATDGYFSPRRYLHTELSARARKGRDMGWAFYGDAGLGLQYIDYRGAQNTQPTQRLTGTVSYVIAPGLEWTFSGTLANVATAVTSSASNYRFGSLSLGGRVPLR